ncbi:hypothetical protein [Sphingobium ummariense]|jgi:hypothetical protein
MMESPSAWQTKRCATAADAGLFSTIELRAIDLGESVDATREIRPRIWIRRLLEFVIGARLPRPLADPRLERLRQFTSLARHHCDRVSEADVVSLVNAGYSQAQAYGLFAYLVERCRAK